MPTAADVVDDLIGLNETVKERYVPTDLLQLAKLWLFILKLSVVLGKILSQNRPGKVATSTKWIESIEKEISECIGRPELATESRSLTFYCYHLNLHCE
jgi:hypothetical protein